MLENRSLIGEYYVQLLNAHIYWIHNSGPDRSREAYLPIPAEYAYAYGIKKGNLYSCYYSGSTIPLNLLAAGNQSRREYAKQFQGNKDLQVLYDWYQSNSAEEGDFVVVSIWDDNTIELKLIKNTDSEEITRLKLFNSKGKPYDESTTSGSKRFGFRLLSLVAKNNNEVVCDYKFIPDAYGEHCNQLMTTLIIGANGVGKSRALGILSEIFLIVQNGNVNREMPYDYYYLKYILSGETIEIEIANRAIIVHKDGALIEKDRTEVLPAKVLAIAFMLNDKFAFKADSADDDSVYEYLGMRMTSNAAWTSTFSNKVAENLIDLATDGKLWNLISELSMFLEIEPKISIGCELVEGEYSADTLSDTSQSKLVGYLKKAGAKVGEKSDYRSDTAKKLTKADYSELAVYLKRLQELKAVSRNNKRIFGLTFNASTSTAELQQMQADYKRFRELNSLRIIKNVTLYIYKDGTGYSFDESSSGEKHILYATLNIARYIKDNSLVLIDEPEISLHPNWQMMYIGFLKRLFKNYPSCHFMIASHSPYLVSDLNPGASSLVTLKIENGVRTARAIEYSTYAWSVENILYNVFHVRTTRNFYFDKDLQQLLDMTGAHATTNIPQLKKLLKKLSGYSYNEKDPLNLILDEAREYIKNAESKE